MTIIYRIISLLINLVACLLAFSLVMSIPLLFSSPVTMLSGFLMVAVILYSWFSFKFRREVLQKQKVVSHSLRDWVRVNGIVTLIFSVLTIMSVIYWTKHSDQFVEALKNFGGGAQFASEKINSVFVFMGIYAALLFIHILWTFALLKKNEAFFQNDTSN